MSSPPVVWCTRPPASLTCSARLPPTGSPGDGAVLSLALPLAPLGPLGAAAVAGVIASVRFGIASRAVCFAATGVSQQLELSGPRRFELAQRFCQLSLSRLQDARLRLRR